MLGVLAIAVLYMGIYPKPFTDVMDALGGSSCCSTWPSPSFPDQTELRDCK